MPRRPAKVTQADIARVLRAAREAGASEVNVDSEGVIRIILPTSTGPSQPESTSAGPEWTPSKALRRHVKTTETR